MTEPSQPDERPRDITRLLFKAVKALPEEEQEAVFRYFFELGIGPPPPSWGQLPEVTELGRRVSAWADPSVATVFGASKPMGPDQIMVPVRLSQAQHARLKAWCTEHNFPMAVVVRGLIDRFLDGWDKRAA